MPTTEELLDELRELSGAVDPVETLFVVDSMAGQDAVNAAAAFGCGFNRWTQHIVRIAPPVSRSLTFLWVVR